MANICEYKVKVKGKKNACYAFYGSMSVMDYKDMDRESGSGSNFELTFAGNCKWAVDSYCKPWDGDFSVNFRKGIIFPSDSQYLKTDQSEPFKVLTGLFFFFSSCGSGSDAFQNLHWSAVL